MGPDHAREVPACTASRTAPLAERVFAGMFRHWRLIGAPGGGCVAVPYGTPVITGDTLSEVVGEISRTKGVTCPAGTGWPAGAAR